MRHRLQLVGLRIASIWRTIYAHKIFERIRYSLLFSVIVMIFLIMALLHFLFLVAPNKAHVNFTSNMISQITTEAKSISGSVDFQRIDILSNRAITTRFQGSGFIAQCYWYEGTVSKHSDWIEIPDGSTIHHNVQQEINESNEDAKLAAQNRLGMFSSKSPVHFSFGSYEPRMIYPDPQMDFSWSGLSLEFEPTPVENSYVPHAMISRLSNDESLSLEGVGSLHMPYSEDIDFAGIEIKHKGGDSARSTTDALLITFENDDNHSPVRYEINRWVDSTLHLSEITELEMKATGSLFFSHTPTAKEFVLRNQNLSLRSPRLLDATLQMSLFKIFCKPCASRG